MEQGEEGRAQQRWRNSRGVQLIACRKARANSADVEKPRSSATSVMELGVSRSKPMALVMRKRIWYWQGGTPKVFLKAREK